MTDLFRGYYSPGIGNAELFFRECTFVIDANVLLDLYRFPVRLRDEVLAIFETVKDRIWIPYQVALEYQENRAQVIIDQEAQYSKVKKTLEKYLTQLTDEFAGMQLAKRHSSIDPTVFMNAIKDAASVFTTEVSTLHETRPQLLKHDVIRDRIEGLFEGRIGPPPESQQWLKAIYDEGKARFERNEPPGFRDQGKASSRALLHRGLRYERQFGDLLLWKQLLEHAKGHKNQSYLFITEDEKEDWWEIVQGEKQGPRRELKEEIYSEAGVTQFQMRSVDRFMRDAATYLDVPVDQDSISQARDILETSAKQRRGVPRVERHQVVDALVEFDRKHRDLPEWQGFPGKQHYRHKYVLKYDGRVYPVKEITSLASGVPVVEYSSGHQVNQQLERLGFEIWHLGDDSSEIDNYDDEAPEA